MFFFTNLLTALGFSLLNSIWQMALTWSFYYLLSGRHKRFSAAVRHDLILTLCLVNIFWFLYGLVSSFSHPASGRFPGFINRAAVQQWIPLTGAVYLLILFFRTFISGFELYKQKKIRPKPAIFIPVFWEGFANKQARLLGISKKIRLLFSEGAETAETSGFLKPLILMPVSLITNLTTRQLEAIIVHELLHIRRNDFLIHLLMNGYRHIFFFNPFADIFYQTLCHQRELACDDGVVERDIPPQIYADALFRLEKYRQIPASFSVAADGNRPWLLRERIARLLGTPVTTASPFRVLPGLSVVIALLLLSVSFQPIPILHNDMAPEKTIAIIPVNFKTTGQRSTKVRLRLKSKRPVMHKGQIMAMHPMEEIQTVNVHSDPELPPVLQFADLREARNFSNENNARTIERPATSMVASPYIPEQSFEFSPETSGDQSDSLIQIRMKQVIAFALIQKVAIKDQLISAENKISSELKNIENRRKVYRHFNEKQFRQLVNKLQKQIEQKKTEIDRINIQTLTIDEEIIHI